MDLRNLISPRLDLPRLSKDLDEIGHWGRVWSVQQWTRSDMATLWEATKGFRPVDLNDFVPSSISPLVEVVHDGKNSLAAATTFQKRFCRPTSPSLPGLGESLVGYNFQSFSAVTGPGYYVAHRSAEPGEVDIDYTVLPKEKPDAWPPIVRNDSLIGRFVYHDMVDVVRGISSHVTIGRSKKKDWLDVWFVLVREDPAPSS